ncbi:MAG: hypothetical protein WCC53_02490 [Thermoanaerobaculia bacterium]
MPSNAPESPSAPDRCRRPPAFLPLIANSVSTRSFGYTSGDGLTLYKGEFKGAFALCVVQAAEILDSNFQRINPDLVVTEPTTVYVRYTASSSAGSSIAATIDTRREDNSIFSAAQPITLSRVGSSAVYLGQATLEPPPAPPSLRAQRPFVTGPLPVPSGEGIVAVILAGNTAGKPDATALTAVPRKLKIEFLDENHLPQPITSNQVVRVVKYLDPTDPSHSLYVEKCWVRIVATLPDGLTIDTDAKGYVSLFEKQNDTLEQAKRLSYGGEKGLATFLREANATPSGPRPGEFLALPLADHGATLPIDLYSLAGPRKNSANVQRVGWDAWVLAQPTIGSSRALEESDIFHVPQWADQGRYELLSTDATPRFIKDGINPLPDWLEAEAWDVIADMRQSPDPIAAEVGSAVNDVSPPTDGFGTGAVLAYVIRPQRIVQLEVTKFTGDETRFDSAFGPVLYHGFNVTETHRTRALIAHEARHCWQNTLPDSDPGGPDGIPDSVGIDTEAYSILDSHSTRRPNGLNTEFDFAGPSVPDTSQLIRSDARERDAIRWEKRYANSALTPDNGCIGPPEIQQGGWTATINAAGVPVIELTTLDPISIWGRSSLSWPDLQTGISRSTWSVLVTARRETAAIPGEQETPSAGAQVVDTVKGPSDSAIGVTGDGGAAFFNVVLVPGLNVFSVIGYAPSIAGDGSGTPLPFCGAGVGPVYFKIRSQ